MGPPPNRINPSCAGEHPSPLTAWDGEDQRRWNRSEKHQNFSEGVPAGPVRGKCRITSCQFISFSCTEDSHAERFFRVNIRSESERGAALILALDLVVGDRWEIHTTPDF